MICLKIDSARRLSRSVIGINIQFIESGKFDLRPLAIKEVTFSQTGEYIKEFIINVPLDLLNQSIQTIYQERQWEVNGSKKTPKSQNRKRWMLG